MYVSEIKQVRFTHYHDTFNLLRITRANILITPLKIKFPALRIVRIYYKKMSTFFVRFKPTEEVIRLLGQIF